MSDITRSETCDTGTGARSRAFDRERDRPRADAARPLILVLGLWGATALLYWPSALDLNRLWTDWSGETYTHGYLVLLLSLWLIVRDRKRLGLTPIRPGPLALIPLVLMSAAWVWFWRSAIQELQLLLLPLMLLSALYAAFGRRMARALAFPVGFLYFAMPFWGDINFLVQALSAKATGVLIWMTGIPAYMEGDYIRLPGGSIEIARSCSGLHALIVGLALSTFYGKAAGERWRRRLIWVAVMGVLSLLVNWVRIFTVVIAAYETDMRSSLVRNHYWLGWWLFAVAFAGFLWWTGRASAAPDQIPPAQGRQSSDSTSGSGLRAAPLIATLAVLAALPVLAYGMDWAHSAADAAAINVQWPAAPAGWTGPSAAEASQWKPHFVNSSGESLTRYTDAAGQPVEAFAVAYRVQTQGAKLLGYWNRLLSPTAAMRQQSVAVADSPGGRWRQIVTQNSDGSRSLLWMRYRIGNRLFIEPRLSQLWYGLAAIVKPPVSSLIALRTPCHPDCAAARARLAGAAEWLHPRLP